MVSGDRYKKMSFSNICSSSSNSPVSRTTKMSVHSFSTRSTFGSSSNMMERDIPLKNSRTNLPITSTTDMYKPTMLRNTQDTHQHATFSISSKHITYSYYKIATAHSHYTTPTITTHIKCTHSMLTAHTVFCTLKTVTETSSQ